MTRTHHEPVHVDGVYIGVIIHDADEWIAYCDYRDADTAWTATSRDHALDVLHNRHQARLARDRAA